MNTLLIMGIAHVIGDYVIQPKRLVNAKAQKRKSLLVHALLYAAAMGFLFFCVQWNRVILPFAILAISHGVIDAIKLGIERKKIQP